MVSYMVLYKINIENKTCNLYFDSNNNWIYFLNEINFTFGFNILNPYNYNTDSYNYFNYYVIEKLKLYKDSERVIFENYIKNCIDNNNFFNTYDGLNFVISKTNLCLKDYEIVY